MAETIRLGGDAVRVTGLKELRSVLRKMGDKELLRELAKVNNRMAGVVVSRARGKASSSMESAAASRLRASRGNAKATVTLGGKPYDIGAEFGALRWHQFRPWRGNGATAGYFLFPAVRESREELIEQYVNEIDKIWEAKAA